MQLAPQACALRLSLRLDTELGRLATSASVRHGVWKRRARSFSLADRVGLALERCPGLPSCWRPARTSRESGLWLALRLRIRKTRPITRCGSMVEGGSTGRRLAASRRASSYLFLESAAGADERARLGREPQPHEIHIPRRAWSVRGGRGRVRAPAMPWATGQVSSQVVRIACVERVCSCTHCEGFAECRRVWFRWFSFFDLL